MCVCAFWHSLFSHFLSVIFFVFFLRRFRCFGTRIGCVFGRCQFFVLFLKFIVVKLILRTVLNYICADHFNYYAWTLSETVACIELKPHQTEDERKKGEEEGGKNRHTPMCNLNDNNVIVSPLIRMKTMRRCSKQTSCWRMISLKWFSKRKLEFLTRQFCRHDIPFNSNSLLWWRPLSCRLLNSDRSNRKTDIHPKTEMVLITLLLSNDDDDGWRGEKCSIFNFCSSHRFN